MPSRPLGTVGCGGSDRSRGRAPDQALARGSRPERDCVSPTGDADARVAAAAPEAGFKSGYTDPPPGPSVWSPIIYSSAGSRPPASEDGFAMAVMRTLARS